MPTATLVLPFTRDRGVHAQSSVSLNCAASLRDAGAVNAAPQHCPALLRSCTVTAGSCASGSDGGRRFAVPRPSR